MMLLCRIGRWIEVRQGNCQVTKVRVRQGKERLNEDSVAREHVHIGRQRKSQVRIRGIGIYAQEPWTLADLQLCSTATTFTAAISQHSQQNRRSTAFRSHARYRSLFTIPQGCEEVNSTGSNRKRRRV